MTTPRRRQSFNPPRELLLTEIARRCRACDASARLGLTKAEARDYRGFECERCGEWSDDELTERDIPEWWEELRVTGLDALRGHARAGVEDVDDPGAVTRLSDAWRSGAREGEDEAGGGSL
jgi:hypothetical protein